MLQRGLNLNLDAWDIPNVLKSNNWRKLKFNYDSRVRIQQRPSIRGVYMIILDTLSLEVKIEPFILLNGAAYTGMSTDLYERFCRHTHPSKDNLLKKLQYHWRNCNFYYLELPDKTRAELEFLEGRLQNLFGPLLNDIKAPKGEEITEIKGILGGE